MRTRCALPSTLVQSTVLWMAFAGAALAHDPGLSSVEATLDPNRLRVRLTLAAADVGLLLPPEANEDDLAPSHRFRAPLAAVARDAFDVRFDDQPVEPMDVQVEVDREENNVHVDLVFPRPRAQTLRLRSALFASLPRGHRQYLTLRDENGELLKEELLDARNHEIAATLPDFSAPKPKPNSSSAPGFVLLGIEHIVRGYDHLLFLFALLVVVRSARRATGLITTFTIAHSISLALATFDVVRLPSTLVEPLIALSIVYVGIENVLGAGSTSRSSLTFAFGLVHGLGFASVLRDLSITASGDVLLPLAAFNLGVELGQVVIALIVLPLLFWMAARPAFFSGFVKTSSALVVLAGSYWLLERTLLA